MVKLGTRGAKEYGWINGHIFARPVGYRHPKWHTDGPYGQTVTLEQAREWVEAR